MLKCLKRMIKTIRWRTKHPFSCQNAQQLFDIFPLFLIIKICPKSERADIKRSINVILLTWHTKLKYTKIVLDLNIEYEKISLEEYVAVINDKIVFIQMVQTLDPPR